MGTLHGNETVNPGKTNTTIRYNIYNYIRKKIKMKIKYTSSLLVLFQFEGPTSVYMKQEVGK